jgi:hypothetical protein
MTITLGMVKDFVVYDEYAQLHAYMKISTTFRDKKFTPKYQIEIDSPDEEYDKLGWDLYHMLQTIARVDHGTIEMTDRQQVMFKAVENYLGDDFPKAKIGLRKRIALSYSPIFDILIKFDNEKGEAYAKLSRHNIVPYVKYKQGRNKKW